MNEPIENTTPAQKQYLNIKKNYKDCILFFRMWDFYETFYEDAKICSNILGIVLTNRDKNSKNAIPMAGVPYHSCDKYISKLIDKWYKVAIADQTSSPKPWQIVSREVVRVVTPWTYIEDKDRNFSLIWWVYFSNEFKQSYNICWWDFTSWEYYTKSFDNYENFIKHILKIELVEITFDINFPQKQDLELILKNYWDILINSFDVPYDIENFMKLNLWVQNLDSYWEWLKEWRLYSCALLFNYLSYTQKSNLKNISKIIFEWDNEYIIFDSVSIKNLEIFKSNYTWEEKYSLLNVLDNMETPMWKKLLKQILLKPIKNINELNYRLEKIQYYYDDEIIRKSIIEDLKKLSDISKLISNLIYRKNSPTILLKLKNNLWIIFWNWEITIKNELIKFWFDKQKIEVLQRLYEKLEKCIVDEIIDEQIDYIKDWFDKTIDEKRKIYKNHDELFLEYQKFLIKTTNLSNIKIKYIWNVWYFIEITPKDVQQFERHFNKEDEKLNFIRKQTLKIWERYMSTYIQTLQNQIIESKDVLIKLEKDILESIKNYIQDNINQLNELTQIIWRIDFFSWFAQLSIMKNLIKPSISNNFDIEIKWWRHILIEQFLEIDKKFIPNDLIIDKTNYMQIITWPNMWWKSTFLRQNALIILMAHCWMRVSADQAKVWIVDGIFARVWSWDVLAKNQSTFMTEMVEMANIINNSTKKSFIILDELWRWTSTYDWMAIAKSIIEYLVNNIWCKTLFATHYHELIWLEWELNATTNFSVAVYETDKEVVFLKKIVKWWANKSYWIDVAKIAWLPKIIIENAKINLKNFEKKKSISIKPLFEIWTNENTNNYNSKKFENIEKTLNKLDLNSTTPIESLNILNNLKKLLKD